MKVSKQQLEGDFIMFKVKLYNKIAEVGLRRLDPALFTVGEDVDAPDAIIVRSAKILPEMLNPELKCIARAGIGFNNICSDECAKRGIAVFNTPGANANAVKELVLGALVLSSRDIFGGAEWVKANADNPDVAALVEKGKAAFTGPELVGKTLGIIGMGNIGRKVAEMAKALGMNVIGYDKYAPCDATEDEVYANSDYITLHATFTDETRHSVNAKTLATMKDGVRIINLARAELVDDDAIIAALESGKVRFYVTDLPNNKTANVPGVIAIPHLGASTPESEDNCAIMAADEVAAFLLRGEVRNKVN
jgi:D-3-phosphoglycerate dehydrogenase